MKKRYRIATSVTTGTLIACLICLPADADYGSTISSGFDTSLRETYRGFTDLNTNAIAQAETMSTIRNITANSPSLTNSLNPGRETIAPCGRQLNSLYSQGNIDWLRREADKTKHRSVVSIDTGLPEGSPNLPSTSTMGLAPIFGWGQGPLLPGYNSRSMNELPPTRLDSFVEQAHERKELIYGDESSWGYPPYFGFTQAHRIDSGIIGRRSAGLTTGHGSMMPSAVGRDEFLGAEWSMSGP